MRLSRPEPYTPHWDSAHLDAWSELGAKAQVLSRSAGEGESFDRVVQEVHVLLVERRFDLITQRINSRRFARALLTIWHSDDDLARETLSSSLLGALLDAQTPRLSRLSTITLVSLYLKYFDDFDSWASGLFEFVGGAVRACVSQQLPSRMEGDLLENVRRTPEYFIGTSAPRALANMLVRDERALPDYLTESGTAGHDLQRFGQLVRREVYLERIRQADPDVENAFIDEIGRPEIVEAPDGKMLFGHTILAELADRPTRAPHEQWVSRVLDIAGDPRMPNRKSFKKWWEPIERRHRENVASWLSAEDLRLFLRALERIGEERHDNTLMRMFPGRKTFLWGLYDLGFVKETRLIVGRSVRNELTKFLKPGFRTDIAEIKDPAKSDTALIAIDCGDFYLVEGSHNVKLWIFDGRRDEELFSRTQYRWDYWDVTAGMQVRFRNRSEMEGDSDAYQYGSIAIAHQGLWQRSALEFFAARGIEVKPHVVLDEHDYRKLKFGSGLPLVQRRRR